MVKSNVTVTREILTDDSRQYCADGHGEEKCKWIDRDEGLNPHCDLFKKYMETENNGCLKVRLPDCLKSDIGQGE